MGASLSSVNQGRFFYIVHNEILFLLLFISLFCYPLEILAVFGQRDKLSEISAHSSHVLAIKLLQLR